MIEVGFAQGSLRGLHRSTAAVRTSWKHMMRCVRFELLGIGPQISFPRGELTPRHTCLPSLMQP